MPTPEALVERMLTMAQVTPRDVVYDLGSGDGRLVIAAAKRGAQAYGVEYNPDLVAFSENRARAQGMAQKAHFVHGDIFETDFSKATVVTLYLLSTLNMRLRPHLLKMRPGTRVVSHAFTMEDWTPDETSRTSDRTCLPLDRARVGAGPVAHRVGGRRTFDVALVQKYQKLEGTITLGTVEAGLREPVLRGDAISFGFVDPAGVSYELDGTVAGDKISGTFKAAAKKGAFTASRR
jgi:SAM-dependent methyltransferase